MAEPSTTAIAITTSAGIGLATLLPGIDGNALIGSFAGATLFVMSATEIGPVKRIIYLLISLIMGYITAPEIMAKTAIEESGVAGFIAGISCVTVGLMLIKKLEDSPLLNLIRGVKK